MARALPLPEGVKSSLSVGYDNNLLNASDAELKAYETNDPDAVFAVDRMEDSFIQGKIEADWGIGRPLGFKSKVRVGYQRIQYLHNSIKSEDQYALELLSRLSRPTRLALEFKHRPQVYGRHRRDKDALPGEPAFRAEVHKYWRLGVELRHMLTEHWQVVVEAGDTYKDYTRAFNERDRNRIEVGAGVEWVSNSWLELGLMAGFRRAESRNKPDLGQDLSYKEWSLEPCLTVKKRGLMPELEMSYKLRWRDYTSDKPEDQSHYKRHDLSGELWTQLTRSLSPTWAFNISFTHAWRRAKLESGRDIDFDEEGSFSEFVVTTGLTWRWAAE